MNSVVIKNLVLGQGIPKICVPLTSSDRISLLSQANLLASQPADLAEWRADLFSSILEEGCLENVLPELRNTLPYIPLLFTFRTAKEGEAWKLPQTSMRIWPKRPSSPASSTSSTWNCFWGRSSHPFNPAGPPKWSKNYPVQSRFFCHPLSGRSVSRLRSMETLGADLAKIAVMPQSPEDVLTLLSATCQAHQQLSCPIISMSMGGTGLVSRLSGEIFGSCMTFGSVGEASPAPGQIPARTLKEILTLTRSHLPLRPFRLFNIHQDNILPHLANITKRDHIFLFPARKSPQMQPGPGTIRARRQPVFMSKSTFPTKPRRLQVLTLITSFCLRVIDPNVIPPPHVCRLRAPDDLPQPFRMHTCTSYLTL